MGNVENRMHSVRIGYYLQYGDTHRLEIYYNNPFNKDTVAVSLEGVIYPTSL